MSVLFIIVIVLLVLFSWIILAPIELIVDTRLPIVRVRLISIGTASVQYWDGEFWLGIEILFIRLRWRVQTLGKKDKEAKMETAKKRPINRKISFAKFLRVLKCFKVRQFELRVQPSDYTVTGRLYAFNFLPLPSPYKLWVSFNAEPYLAIRITTAPWRLAYALLLK